MAQKFFKEIGEGNKTSKTKRHIISYLIDNGNATITDLSKELNMSIPTTTKFVNEMCASGYLDEYGKLETGEGRRPNLYGLNAESGYFIGVDVKKFSISIGLMNFKGDLVEHDENIDFKSENTSEALDFICQQITSFIDKTDVDSSNILNANINLSGRVNPETGYSYSFFNFSEEPLTKILSDKLGLPVSIENDSRAMAYGEFAKGCVKGEKNVLFINASWGLGMGIIIDGKPYKGKSGFSGEIGHIHLYNNEILCHCGKKGCLETEVSGMAFHRIVTERMKNGESTILSKINKNCEKLTLADLIKATNQEDMLCIDVIESIGQKLGDALAGIINIFNPELLIIGGPLALTGDYLLQPLKTSLRKYSLNLVNRDTAITLSKLKDKTGLVGACLLARNNMLEL